MRLSGYAAHLRAQILGDSEIKHLLRAAYLLTAALIFPHQGLMKYENRQVLESYGNIKKN